MFNCLFVCFLFVRFSGFEGWGVVVFCNSYLLKKNVALFFSCRVLFGLVVGESVSVLG